jgi:gluconokinase
MIVVLMGVSGSGKTTIGEQLARRLGWRFIEGDEYHPPENIAKMAAGIALDDADRWPWLDRLNQRLRTERDAVVTCSALKETYRRRLLEGIVDARLVYLEGSRELIASRVQTRKHKYMPASLLDSQFQTLEPPREAVRIDVAQPIERSLDEIVKAIGPSASARPA